MAHGMDVLEMYPSNLNILFPRRKEHHIIPIINAQGHLCYPYVSVGAGLI